MSVQEATAELAPKPTLRTRTALKVATGTAVLRDLFIVTWAIPEEAARTLVPEGIVLDRLPGEDGQLQAFVQLTFALRDDSRWSPLPAVLGDDYHEAVLQVLTRTDNERSTYVLKHYAGNTRVASALFPFSRAVEEGRFHVYISGDPARHTFEKLGVKVTTDAVRVHVRAEVEDIPEVTSLGRWHDAVTFLTQREHVFHPARLSKEGTTLFKVEHPPLTPFAAKLTYRIVRPLDEIELGEPVLALYQPELVITSYPPKRQR